MRRVHLKIINAAAFVAGLLALVLCTATAVSSCSAGAKSAVKTAVDVADVACVLIHSEAGSGVAADICAVEEELSPLVQQLLAARRAKAAGSTKTPPQLELRDPGAADAGKD